MTQDFVGALGIALSSGLLIATTVFAFSDRWVTAAVVGGSVGPAVALAFQTMSYVAGSHGRTQP